MQRIARARLQDARALLRNRRYDGAIYLCGYAIELCLKARICRVLDWDGFPSTGKEFEGLQSFRTHNLETLLRLSGRDRSIRKSSVEEWSAVIPWTPEFRYNPIGTATPESVRAMIKATTILMREL